MADDRRRRFLQIERPRGPGAPDPAPAGPGVGDRFGVVERAPAPPPGPGPSPAPAEAAPSGHVDRFRPAAERPLEVDDGAAGRQPFLKCCRCETDNTRFAVRCTTCGSDLLTDEQRAFNDRLWEGRRAEDAAAAAAEAERRAALDAAEAEAAVARRALAESMAREVGERERRRLDAEGLGSAGWGPPAGGGAWPPAGGGGEPSFGPPSDGGWGPPSGGGTGWSRTGDGLTTGGLPLAFRILGLLPDPRWRVAAGVAAIAVPALLFLVAPRIGLGLGVLLVSLFLPGGWTRRRRRWW